MSFVLLRVEAVEISLRSWPCKREGPSKDNGKGQLPFATFDETNAKVWATAIALARAWQPSPGGASGASVKLSNARSVFFA